MRRAVTRPFAPSAFSGLPVVPSPQNGNAGTQRLRPLEQRLACNNCPQNEARWRDVGSPADGRRGTSREPVWRCATEVFTFSLWV